MGFQPRVAGGCEKGLFGMESEEAATPEVRSDKETVWGGKMEKGWFWGHLCYNMLVLWSDVV